MPFTKPNKGSVLVFSLIVLSIVLSAALSVAVVNVSNRKSAGSTGQSIQSFQVADSGVEKTLKEIYKGSYTDLSTMRASITGSTACSNGSFSFPVSGGTSTVTFFDTDNAVIGCTESDWRNLVAKIKVEGTSAGTTRVIETAIAAPGCRWITIDSSATGSSLTPEPVGLCRFTLPANQCGTSNSRNFVWYGSIFHNQPGVWSCGVLTQNGGYEASWKNSSGSYAACSNSSSNDSAEPTIDYLTCS